jgi:hypothetical protein
MLMLSCIVCSPYAPAMPDGFVRLNHGLGTWHPGATHRAVPHKLFELAFMAWFNRDLHPIVVEGLDLHHLMLDPSSEEARAFLIIWAHRFALQHWKVAHVISGAHSAASDAVLAPMLGALLCVAKKHGRHD